ncbi:MAG: phosphoribosylglycinamide formyltransferase [Phycisphaerales bacterium]|nr:phosphoribosylglycinamide formyltransferase [Phycisphaerales bacterium]
MKSIIIFASGKGTNTEAIIQYFAQTRQAKVALIVCNKPNAGVLDVARNHDIPFLLITKKTLEEPLIVVQIKEYRPDLIVLAGFFWKIPEMILQAFPNQVINIHPALLPKYGGKGMYGHFVHEAVLAAKEKETGITIHYVNNHYDEGAHLLQAHCSLHTDDSVEDVAQKVSRLEHSFYPKTIEYILNGQ